MFGMGYLFTEGLISFQVLNSNHNIAETKDE